MDVFNNSVQRTVSMTSRRRIGETSRALSIFGGFHAHRTHRAIVGSVRLFTI